MVKVLLVDESDYSNYATVERSRSWVDDKIGDATFSSLPDDEGLDPDSCYRLEVKIT